MADRRYSFTREQLVKLLALEAEYATLVERGRMDWYTDRILDTSEVLLTHVGVENLTELNEEIGVELERVQHSMRVNP